MVDGILLYSDQPPVRCAIEGHHHNEGPFGLFGVIRALTPLTFCHPTNRTNPNSPMMDLYIYISIYLTPPGRVLILEGIEKAERNVLPTLNNLLENREMVSVVASDLSVSLRRVSRAVRVIRYGY